MPDEKKYPAREVAALFDEKPPPKQPPGPKPMSLAGYGENVMRNAYDIARGFVDMFPYAIKAGAEIWENRDGLADLMQDPRHLVDSMRDTASAVGRAVIDPYEKHGLRVLYEEPITPVLDAMTILSLGGASIAKAGRLAGVPRLIETGTKIAGLPERIGARLMEAPLRMVGINPETRKLFLTMRREEQSMASVQGRAWADRVLAGGRQMTDEDWARLDKLIHEGGTAQELAASPRVKAVYDQLQAFVKTARESELGPKGRALLGDKQMSDAVVKKYADRRNVDFQTAKAEVARLEVKPVYAPAIRESAGNFTLSDALTSPSVIRKGKVGFLEKFVSGLGASKDPRIYIPRAIGDFYKMRAQLRLIDRVIQTPGLARTAKRGEASLRDLLPSQGIHAKYYGDRARAQSLAISDLEREAGGKMKAADILAKSPEARKRVEGAVNIAIEDETLRKLIARESRSVGGEVGWYLQAYDRITDLFRLTATKLSPRWYTGNVVGDALLASLAGANWNLARDLIKSHLIPADLRAGGASIVAESGRGWLDNLADAVGGVDDAARAGIFTKAVADKLKSTLAQYGASEEAFRKVLAEVAMSPEKLSEAMVRTQLMGERAARSSVAIGKIDAAIASDGKKLRALVAERDALKARQSARGQAVAVEGEALPTPAVAGESMAVSAAEGQAVKAIRRTGQHGKVAGKPIPTPEVMGEAILIPPSALGEAGAEMRLQRQPLAETAPFAKDIRRLDVEIEALSDRVSALGASRDSMVADIRDAMMRRETERIPELTRQAELARYGIDRANAFLGEYQALGPIERGVFRRLIPFYPWVKAMSKLAFTFPFLSPGKAFFWHRYAGAMAEMMGDPELPDWMAGYAPVFMRQNGDTVWARLTSLSPFGSLRTEHVGGVPIPGILAFWQANPWISAGFKLIGGKDTWNAGSVPYGEPLVAVNDGEVYKFNERGKLERIIAQPPLISTLAHMFPPVQMLEQLISNFDVRKGKPALNADGSVRYPIELWQRLADVGGLKLMQRNREDAIRSEKFKVRAAMRELKGAYKKAGPEDREYIKGVFEDYVRGEYRRIEARR